MNIILSTIIILSVLVPSVIYFISFLDEEIKNERKKQR